jgi:hypothetical protein
LTASQPKRAVANRRENLDRFMAVEVLDGF